jgi:hypothetical protein
VFEIYSFFFFLCFCILSGQGGQGVLDKKSRKNL